MGNPHIVVEFGKDEQLHSKVSFLLSLFLRFLRIVQVNYLYICLVYRFFH